MANPHFTGPRFGSKVFMEGEMIWDDENANDCPEDCVWSRDVGELADSVAWRQRHICATEVYHYWQKMDLDSPARHELYECMSRIWDNGTPLRYTILQESEKFMWFAENQAHKDGVSYSGPVVAALNKLFDVYECKEYEEYVRILGFSQKRTGLLSSYEKYGHLYEKLMVSKNYSSLFLGTPKRDEALAVVPGRVKVSDRGFLIMLGEKEEDPTPFIRKKPGSDDDDDDDEEEDTPKGGKDIVEEPSKDEEEESSESDHGGDVADSAPPKIKRRVNEVVDLIAAHQYTADEREKTELVDESQMEEKKEEEVTMDSTPAPKEKPQVYYYLPNFGACIRNYPARALAAWQTYKDSFF